MKEAHCGRCKICGRRISGLGFDGLMMMMRLHYKKEHPREYEENNRRSARKRAKWA